MLSWSYNNILEDLKKSSEILGGSDIFCYPFGQYNETDIKAVKEAGITIKGCSHITGGGFYENVPRMLPEGKHAVIKKDSYEVPAIFKMMEREGNVEEHMMYNTYNMGIGMIVAVDPADVEKTMEAMRAAGDTPYVIGEIKDGEKGVTLC